jgi:hypothetical protein
MMSQSDPGFDFESKSNTNKRTIMVDGQPVDMDTFMQMQSGGQIPVPKKRRRSGCGCGLVILALVIIVPLVAVFAIATGVLNSIGSNIPGLGDLGNMIATVSNAIKPPETRTISGDPTKFDPMAGLDDAQDMAGAGAKIASIRATYVRSDGTMDLTANYNPRTEYEFLREIPRPTDAPPPGVAGSSSGPWYEPISIDAYRPGQVSHVTSMGGGINTEYSYTNEGMIKEVSDPTTNPFDDIAPEPKCKFVDLWKAAMKKGAAEEAVAIIEYNADGYSFVISGSDGISLDFDMNCKLVD